MPLKLSVALCVAIALTLTLPATNAESEYPPSLVAPTEPLTPEQERAKFHLPPGFAIELVAAEPLIHKPMNLNFDGHGRLYVTSSLEYPFPAKPGQPARDTVHVLSDSDGDGRLDHAAEVVGGLNIPIGVTPVAEGLIYYSIPRIFRWQGDVERPDGRPGELLYGTFGFGDTHGMANSFTRWIDGWIYACHGFANTSEVEGADKKGFQMQSGNTFRMRSDGSHVEPNTRGQVNPFGLCFDPLGNLYSADCHTMPVYQLLRGAYYESFGKPHDGLGFGPKMIGHNHGSTGIAGVVYYAADHFPVAYRETVFIGNPVTGRINHDRLQWHGSSPQAVEQVDFLTCDDPWFRPVDLKLGPDGALYVADFYNCIIGHYEVPLQHPRRDRERGRIWRITYVGDRDAAETNPRPSGDGNPKLPNVAALPSASLAELLGHPNLTVRVLATEELAARPDLPGKEALLPNDEGEPSATRRAHGLWLIERREVGGLDGETIERLRQDPSRLVRTHLLKALAERTDWSGGTLDLASLVRKGLDDADAFVRRAAADALGRHPAVESVAPLMNLWRTTSGDDTHLIHVVRMALRDHLAQPDMYTKLHATTLDAEDRSRLADVSLGVHTPAAAAYLLAFIESQPVGGRTSEFVYEIARYLPAERMADVYAWLEKRPRDDVRVARDIVLALHRAGQARGIADPEQLIQHAVDLARTLLASNDAGLIQGGVELSRELRLAALHDALAALIATEGRPIELRSAAIDACVANDAARSIPLLSQALGQIEQSTALRQKAAAALANLPEATARDALVAQLRTASDRLAVEIAAGLAARPEGAEALLSEVQAGRASPRLLQERTVAERLRRSNVTNLDERLAALTANLPPADERINQLIATRRNGFAKAQSDAVAGRQIFQKACAACHRVGGEGGKIGPDLDGVGLRGADRLLEDVLDPSRNVDQAFRITVVATNDGRSLSGLVLREEGAVLVLADQQGKEVRLPLDEIEERAIGALSPMPANVADLVAESDFYHLIAFLLSQRQAPQKLAD
ncbi:MAG TPA: PVC-type heme-binding CxxCH protein [Pirellulales bacterium]|nr:PVC-type heme-binding CxxCH protein [Pirellulales bacterium]